MGYESAFSPDYSTSRKRFREAAGELGCRWGAFEIGVDGPDGSPLTIDFARLGPEDASQVIIVSSGTHGVEGFFGAAVQLALLQTRLKDQPLPQDVAILLIHAMNPYGFAFQRRVTEDNVDLNRNFMMDPADFAGVHPDYVRLEPLLNPPTPPQLWDPFVPMALFNLIRHGFSAMKNALVQGQYVYPKGLFYGGTKPTNSHRVLKEQLPTWIGPAKKVVHLDLHTGMGRWGTYVLAVSNPDDDPKTRWLKEHFGEDKVQALDPSQVLYEIRGVLGTWCQAQRPDVQYHCMLAEFGTYNVFRVLKALRNENRATHWSEKGSPDISKARSYMLEAFAPASTQWRNGVVRTALSVFDQAITTTDQQHPADTPDSNIR